ncbi:HepT-like ribonuclease domain-containing protein [Curtobacterium sp. SGAir0471]|uniref:HepT-like ribonuclease domain-containing protein n=1 Tax=Curtobacterium sp. SGAir0471 TaxID=2070337 RepID=UPI0015863F02|nr:HepT-like ribonuclease domain-containing protein [Curtobacterium sp. SGAir0471]
MTDRFTPKARSDRHDDRDRWPAIRDGLIDLLAECSSIVEHGRDTFEAPRSLTYRAAEAVVIHFDDLLGRLPEDRRARLPVHLSLAAVRRTRNILSHDYRKARKDIVWDVIEQHIPGVILAIVE